MSKEHHLKTPLNPPWGTEEEKTKVNLRLGTSTIVFNTVLLSV